MKSTIIDRVLLLLILAVMVINTFWQRPSEPEGTKTEYITGKADTTKVVVNVTFPDIYMPPVNVSYQAPIDSAAGIVPSNCDSIRGYETTHQDSATGVSVTVGDSIHGKLLRQRVKFNYNELHINRVDTLKITNNIQKTYFGPYVGLGLDSGIVNLQIGASFVGKKGVWTGFYKTNDRSFNIGRTFQFR